MSDESVICNKFLRLPSWPNTSKNMPCSHLPGHLGFNHLSNCSLQEPGAPTSLRDVCPSSKKLDHFWLLRHKCVIAELHVNPVSSEIHSKMALAGQKTALYLYSTIGNFHITSFFSIQAQPENWFSNTKGRISEATPLSISPSCL